MYHITDKPELRSSGKHFIIDPENEFPIYETSVRDHTEFHFTWRTQKTPLSNKIQMDTWDENKITNFKENLSTAIYRVIIFLRHVFRIEIYDNGTRICSVEKDFKSKWQDVTQPKGYYYNFLFTPQDPNRSVITRKQWSIKYQKTTDTWLSYGAKVRFKRSDFEDRTYAKFINLLDTSKRIALS